VYAPDLQVFKPIIPGTIREKSDTYAPIEGTVSKYPEETCHTCHHTLGNLGYLKLLQKSLTSAGISCPTKGQKKKIFEFLQGQAGKYSYTYSVLRWLM